MFIGHYGPAFGAKAALRNILLWVFFIAVQQLDVVWSILVITGIEKPHVTPGFTQGSALDLHYMPYTHGLIGVLVLSAVFGGCIALLAKTNRGLTFVILAAAVFSHQILDLVVHVPDLWVYDGVNIGFGLWRWMWISLPLELFVLIAGAWLYARYVPARNGGNRWLWLFVAALAAIELYGSFGPPPTSPQIEAEMALGSYAILALLAAIVDLSRKPV